MRLLNKVGAVATRLFTWEVVTGFDQELSDSVLMRRLNEECPGLFCELRNAASSRTPPLVKFWKMISFNGAEGRRHRYLVALCREDLCGFRWRYDRILPRQIGLYKVCDMRMRNEDGLENFRYATIVSGVLYILVFMEGRLCHWSEEAGYGQDETAENIGNAESRLRRFDEFLKRDELFSRVDRFAVAFDGDGAENCDDFSLFREAAYDPFWKKLDLDDDVGVDGNFSLATKPRQKIKYALIFIMVSLFVFSINSLLGQNDYPEAIVETSKMLVADESAVLYDFPNIQPQDSTAEKLDSVQVAQEKKLSRNRHPLAPQNRRRLSNASEYSCPTPSAKIQGLVAEKIAQIVLPDLSKRWVRVGDSLEKYQVQSIGRDRIHLVCGGLQYELRSEK